jgi:hypothetical protein
MGLREYQQEQQQQTCLFNLHVRFPSFLSLSNATAISASATVARFELYAGETVDLCWVVTVEAVVTGGDGCGSGY